MDNNIPLTPTVKLNKKGAMTMDFPDAMRKIIEGKKVARVEWGNSDYCFLKGEWLSIFTKGKDFCWKVNDGDMLANDWFIVEQVN